MYSPIHLVSWWQYYVHIHVWSKVTGALSRIVQQFSLQVECERVDIPTGPKEVSPDCGTTSDSEGDFVFPSLPPGIYTLVRWGITLHSYN